MLYNKGAFVKCLPNRWKPLQTVSISNLNNHKQIKGKYKSVKNCSEFWKMIP